MIQASEYFLNKFFFILSTTGPVIPLSTVIFKSLSTYDINIFFCYGFRSPMSNDLPKHFVKEGEAARAKEANKNWHESWNVSLFYLY